MTTFPEVWQVFAVGACLVSAGAAGAAVAAWLVLTLADTAPAALTEPFTALITGLIA